MSICVLSGPALGCPPLTVAPPVHINQWTEPTEAINVKMINNKKLLKKRYAVTLIW